MITALRSKDGRSAVSNPGSLAKASCFSNLKLYLVATYETSHVIFSFSSHNQHHPLANDSRNKSSIYVVKQKKYLVK